MNFLKRAIQGKVDQATHKKFRRYGKGTYQGCIINITKGNTLKLKTSLDLSNDFVLILSEIPSNFNVSGNIIANYDFEKELINLGIEVLDYKKKGKVYTAKVKTTLNNKDLKRLYEMFNNQYLFLDISCGKNKLKIKKKKLPKPGGKVKDDLCSLSLENKYLDIIKREFLFDFDNDFKKLTINHTYSVKELIIPKEYKDDLLKARLYSKRKGVIKREFLFDNKKQVKEYSFEA